jgi:MraZ protein
MVVERTPLFVGEHDLVLDGKSRLSIPSDMRKLLDPAEHGNCLFLVFGLNKKLWIYTEREYEHLAKDVPAGIAPGAATMIYRQVTFASTTRVELDKQGRVLIPEKTKQRTGLTTEVTLIGAGNHLEVWPRSEYQPFMDVNLERITDIAQAAMPGQQDPSMPSNF